MERGRMSTRKRRSWAIAVRVLAVPLWYPFAALAWIGERADTIFWWIEQTLPSVYSNTTRRH
jgi:hypothetical protein